MSFRSSSNALTWMFPVLAIAACSAPPDSSADASVDSPMTDTADDMHTPTDSNVSPSDAGADVASTGDSAVDSSLGDAAGDVSDASTTATLVWRPGHYLIVNTAESGAGSASADRITALFADADAHRFAGVQVKLLWRDFETSMDHYDFTALDAVLDAAASASPCTAGDGSRAACSVALQIQYKTADPSVPAIPDYLLSTGVYCTMSGRCEIPADPAARTALQRTFCATTGAQRCGAHEFSPVTAGGGGESLAMMWLPGVESRFQALVRAIEAHVLAGPRSNVISAYALPETTFEWDPEGTVLFTDEGYTRAAYEASLRRSMIVAHEGDPSRVTFQFVGNLPPLSRSDLSGWESMVRGFYDFASMQPGIGIGHPDVAPLLGPTAGTPPATVNPAINVMRDSTYFARVPRNPNTQAPDVMSDRTTGFADSWDLLVNGVRGNYIAWTTSTRSGSVFTWHDVAAYIATHPLPAANLAAPAW